MVRSEIRTRNLESDTLTTRPLTPKAVLTMRYDYDPTYTTYRALLPIRREQKMNMSIFRRSCVVVVSQSNRNCDIGFKTPNEQWRTREPVRCTS